jgi:hypothetical protein
MNAYRVDIWKSVKHNGKFVTNIQRVIVIHARNTEEAKAKAILKKSTVNKLEGLIVEASAEYIYSCEKIGTVTIEKFYVYSNHDYSPVPVEEYRNSFKRQNGDAK